MLSKLLDTARRGRELLRALAASRDPQHLIETARLGDRSEPAELADGALRWSESEPAPPYLDPDT